LKKLHLYLQALRKSFDTCPLRQTFPVSARQIKAIEAADIVVNGSPLALYPKFARYIRVAVRGRSSIGTKIEGNKIGLAKDGSTVGTASVTHAHS
jgi:hexokinase